MTLALGFLFLLFLILANAFSVALEFGLVAADRGKLKRSAEEGKWSAKVAIGLSERLSFHLSGAQLVITITSLVLGRISGPLAAQVLDPVFEPLFGSRTTTVSVVFALIVMTVFQMVAGELIPKNIAIAHPQGTVQALAPTARVVNGALTPIILLFNGIANMLVRRLGIEPQEELASISTLEEIEYLIRSSGEHGALGAEATDLLTRTVRFGDKTAADALTPRVHVKALASTATVSDLIALTEETGFTRFPVYGEHLDDILGVVRIHRIFELPYSKRGETPVIDLMREPFVVPESRDLVDILEDYRATESQLLIVVDEHGGTAGVLTLEDVLEEIVGEIDDEFDETEVLTSRNIPGVYIVAGTLHHDEVEAESGFVTPEGEYETIAGFVLEQLGRIPVAGDSFEVGDWLVEVVEMDKLRIASIQLSGRGVKA